MISVLEKMKKDEIKYKKSETIFDKILRWKDILTGSTHPNSDKRIQILIENIKNEYLSLYPNNKKIKEYVDQFDNVKK
jgi:hypothetical protein